MKIRYVVPLVLIGLFVLLAPLPVEANEHILEWSTVDTPGLNGNIVVTPSEVNEIAVGSGGIIYALDTSTNATKLSKVYKSINAGSSWTDITPSLIRAGAVLPATKIAASPDTTNLVAVVTDGNTSVYLSINGGGKWFNLGVPALVGKIQAITISKKYTDINSGSTINEIAIGTAEWGNATTTGQVWVYQYGVSLATWQNQNLTIDPAHIGGEVSAIAYSPGYSSDKTLIVVASTSSDVAVTSQNRTWLCLGKRYTDPSAGTTQWNDPTIYPGYPVAIGTSPDGGDGIGVVQVSSSLALPSNYSITDTDKMQLFVSFDRDPDPLLVNDAYLIYNPGAPVAHRLDVNGGGAVNLSSITYYGTTTSGELIAGDVSPSGLFTTQVRRTADPFNLAPHWYTATIPPTGPGNAKVCWSTDGSTVYCGTGQIPGVGLDESAFSISTDGGDNWQQNSLIDTILKLADFAITPDSKTLYISTHSDLGPEGVWRSTLIEEGIGVYWSRQLNVNTTSERINIRLSPKLITDYTIYAFEPGTQLLYVSHDRGNSWKKRLTPGPMIDGVLADANTLYVALPGGYVRRATESGLLWSKLVPTGIDDINMLTITSNGTILVGGRNGEVAYSTDNGTSFTLINKVIGIGDVQVIADIDFQDNSIIYASTNATDIGIRRWQIGTSTQWEQIDKPITDLGAGQRIGGFATGPEGTLYALREEPAGGISRSLNPAALENIEFDIANEALPADTTLDSSAIFTHTVPYLKISTETGQNELWSIDTTHELIYRFKDTLATVSPTLNVPLDAFQDMINLKTSRARDIAFSWNTLSRDIPSLEVTGYEIGVYFDAACIYPAQICYVTSNFSVISVVIGPYQPAASNQYIEYAAGKNYYWRVRAVGPLKSPWSEVRSFTIVLLHEQVINVLSPLNGAEDINRTPAFSWEPAISANDYEFLLADDADFNSPILVTTVNGTGYALTEKLEYGKTYFWKVRAISPSVSEWSVIANFTIQEAPPEPSDVVPIRIKTSTTTITMTAPTQTQLFVASSHQTSSVPDTIWVIIGVGSILLIGVIVLIIRTKR
jgi:photosystem II stability/assembly factor-like uncharacterized protein